MGAIEAKSPYKEHTRNSHLPSRIIPALDRQSETSKLLIPPVPFLTQRNERQANRRADETEESVPLLKDEDRYEMIGERHVPPYVQGEITGGLLSAHSSEQSQQIRSYGGWVGSFDNSVFTTADSACACHDHGGKTDLPEEYLRPREEVMRNLLAEEYDGPETLMHDPDRKREGSTTGWLCAQDILCGVNDHRRIRPSLAFLKIHEVKSLKNWLVSHRYLKRSNGMSRVEKLLHCLFVLQDGARIETVAVYFSRTPTVVKGYVQSIFFKTNRRYPVGLAARHSTAFSKCTARQCSRKQPSAPSTPASGESSSVIAALTKAGEVRTGRTDSRLGQIRAAGTPWHLRRSVRGLHVQWPIPPRDCSQTRTECCLRRLGSCIERLKPPLVRPEGAKDERWVCTLSVRWNVWGEASLCARGARIRQGTPLTRSDTESKMMRARLSQSSTLFSAPGGTRS
jgi:hypothetical protein